VSSCGGCTAPETCGGGGTANVCGTTGGAYLYFEAESGTGANTAPMTIVNDAAASNGQCIWSGTTGSNASVPANGHVTFTFNAPSAGTYKVWGRFLVGPATTSDDSLWIRIDSSAWINWNDIHPRIGNAGYAWDSEHDDANADAPVNHTLTAGNHTLEIAYRENGLKMDRFLVTNDLSFTPGGTTGPKIASLTVNDTANAADWAIQSNFQAGTSATGSHPWTDWPNTYVSAIDSGISASLVGKEWIRVDAASKTYAGGPEAAITLNGTADVYLMIDDRWNAGARPTWLDTSWVDTGFAITVWESATKPSLTLSVYKKAGASGTVTTPMIGASTAYNYFIVVN
jgi:hypothetical protein